MTMSNPKGRANYEPNSWGGTQGGPREAPRQGFRSFPETEAGDKLRVRAELFADHYSQARLFYLSQTSTEQTHIKDAFVFELSKVETPEIRARMVAHLMMWTRISPARWPKALASRACPRLRSQLGRL
jgi:catalase